MILVEVLQYPVVHRFDGSRDEQASTALQLRQHLSVIDEMLHFDDGIEGDAGKFRV